MARYGRNNDVDVFLRKLPELRCPDTAEPRIFGLLEDAHVNI